MINASENDHKEIYEQALGLLKSSIGKVDVSFHKGQWEAISDLVIDKSKLLVVQRTGWGKSSVYFIATKLLRERGFGPTIILSPLLALMRNQVQSAASYGVTLGSINSSQDLLENESTINKLLSKKLDALIISPEQLAKPDIIENVIKPISNQIGLLVIDEAHCISDWGHDFRPDYKRIKSVLSFLPVNIPVLLTTATANNRVMNDISSQLGDNIEVHRGHLTRKSLQLQCIQFPKRSQRLAWLADTLPTLDGTGIIYTATIRDAKQVANWLKSCGFNVGAYHGAVSAPKRLQLEHDLIENNIKALVATSALGMGYDKPDLAFVIHYQSPGSVVSYYQQVGRAGRAIVKAYGVLLSGDEDDHIQKFFIDQAFPKENLVNEILSVIENAEKGLKRNQIIDIVNGQFKKIESALKFLLSESPAPIIKNQENIYSRTLIEYELPHDLIKRLSESKENEWNEMQNYLHYKNCLMERLSEKLDDNDTKPCGKCANCWPEGALSTKYSENSALEAGKFMQNIDIPINPKKRAGNSHAQVGLRFPIYQFPFIFGELEHEPGRALCYWGDAGWGEIAMEGKKNGFFDPRLIFPSVQMIKKRWKPDPFPNWLTYIPSQNHPELVANFAKELANILDIECFDAVNKIKLNKPQKKMQNTSHRCKNLDGVFEISSNLPNGPVLLVDDIYDSGWTFAVVSALLRRSGSGKVLPFSVMSASNS